MTFIQFVHLEMRLLIVKSLMAKGIQFEHSFAYNMTHFLIWINRYKKRKCSIREALKHFMLVTEKYIYQKFNKNFLFWSVIFKENKQISLHLSLHCLMPLTHSRKEVSIFFQIINDTLYITHKIQFAISYLA